MNDLTPVERVSANLYLKRDDLFTAYSGLIRGAKMRQTIQDVRYLRTRCKRVRTVVLSTSVNGTTGTIAAEVAKEHGLACIVCVGATTEERLRELPMMRLAKAHGATISIVAGTAYASVLQSRVREIVQKAGYECAMLDYGLWWPRGTTEQVENLPNRLDNLVIPCGTGIQMAAILYGLSRSSKAIRRVIGVRVGPDRRKAIDRRLRTVGVREYMQQTFFGRSGVQYELHQCAGHLDYSKPVHASVAGIDLDPYYEAKAYTWMLNNLDPSEKTCFWIVGKHPTEAEIDAYCKGD